MPDDDDDFYTYYSDDPDSYDPPSDDGETGEESKTPKQTDPEPMPPKPVSLDVDYSGENGRYVFFIQVMSDQNRGFQANVLILEGERMHSIKQTDENGFLEHRASLFKEPDRDFLFRVTGTNLELEYNLDGPEKPKPPPIRTIPGGFWANVKHTIAEIKKRKGN